MDNNQIVRTLLRHLVGENPSDDQIRSIAALALIIANHQRCIEHLESKVRELEGRISTR